MCPRLWAALLLEQQRGRWAATWLLPCAWLPTRWWRWYKTAQADSACAAAGVALTLAAGGLYTAQARCRGLEQAAAPAGSPPGAHSGPLARLKGAVAVDDDSLAAHTLMMRRTWVFVLCMRVRPTVTGGTPAASVVAGDGCAGNSCVPVAARRHSCRDLFRECSWDPFADSS